MALGDGLRHAQSTIPTGLTAAILLLAVLLYLLNVAPARFGFYHDDSLYVATGKAIAAGDGYRIPSLPQSPPQTKYPPFYPLVLALAWRLYPRFPQNLTPMLYVSVILVLLLHLCVWGYLKRWHYASPWQVLVIIALLSFNFRELILATSLLSEPLYGLLSVAALALGEAYAESRRRDTGLLLSLLVALSLLTRISGIAVLIALIFHLRRKRILEGSFAILIPPIIAFGLWLAWCRAAGSGASASIPDFSFYTSYSKDWMRMLSEYARQIDQPFIVALAILILKNLLMSVVASTSVVIMGLSYQSLPTLRGFPLGLACIAVLFSLLLFGFFSQRRSHPGILHTYTVTYLALHIIWPYTAYDRFLMPVLPFLLLYLVSAAGNIGNFLTRQTKLSSGAPNFAPRAFLTAFFLLGSLFIGYNQLSGWARQIAGNKRRAVRFTQCDEPVFAWLESNTKPSDILACYQDVKYFLYTGRKAVRIDFPLSAPERGQSCEKVIQQAGVTCLILASDDFALESRAAAMRKGMRSCVLEHPDTFEKVLDDARCDSLVFRIRQPAQLDAGVDPAH